MQVANIPGLNFWLDAETLNLSHGATVSRWNGVSPTTIYATGAAKSPTLEIIDNRKFVRFNKATKQRMDVSANIASGNEPWTIFAVAIPLQTGHIFGFQSSAGGWDAGSDTYLKGFDYNGSNFRSHAKYNGVGVHLQSKQSYHNEIVVLASQYQNQNSWLQVFAQDRTERVEDKTNAITTYPYSKTTLGAGDGSSSDAYIHAFDGYIGEVLAFNRALTKEEVDVVNNYLTTKWLSPLKILVQSNDDYLTLKNGAWEVVSSGVYPTTQQWFESGMGTLSFADAAVEALGEQVQVAIWANDAKYDAFLEINGVKEPQIVDGAQMISLIGAEEIDAFFMEATAGARVAISFDQDWLAFRDGQWQVIDNTHDGMSASEINALTKEQINEAKAGSQFIRFSHATSGYEQIKHFEMRVTETGTEQLAATSDYVLHYDQFTKTITVDYVKDGTYSINYIDAK